MENENTLKVISIDEIDVERNHNINYKKGIMKVNLYTEFLGYELHNVKMVEIIKDNYNNKATHKKSVFKRDFLSKTIEIYTYEPSDKKFNLKLEASKFSNSCLQFRLIGLGPHYQKDTLLNFAYEGSYIMIEHVITLLEDTNEININFQISEHSFVSLYGVPMFYQTL
jgi:hypothetical protein